jgi:Tol biopolymer transport system component
MLRLALLVFAFGALAEVARAAPADTRLVSRASGAAGVKADDASTTGGISADGTVISFHTPATTVHPDDLDGAIDVYARDARTATTHLVSRADGAAGAPGNDNSFGSRISADGRFVAFTSVATNLHPADTDAGSDIFVRDLTTATTTLVSRAGGPGDPKANGGSSQPSISADGRYVAFASTATNLPDDADATSDVFVRDLLASTTTLVSRASSGEKGNGSSFAPSISDDGRRVAFGTAATNLDADGSDPDSAQDIYVRNLDGATTALVSRAPGVEGAKADGFNTAGQIAPGGNAVAFASNAPNLGAPEPGAVFVRDLQAATTTLASRASGIGGAPANGGALFSTLSADGRYVAFASGATNLHPDDTDSLGDVFVRDLVAATTTLVSRASGEAGAKANGGTPFESGPAISGDGTVVAFESTATNLDPDDDDAGKDLFTRELGAGSAPPPPTGPGPAAGGAQTPAPGGQPPGPLPVAGRSELVEPVSGIVRVRRRGTRRFVRLRAGTLLPDRSEIDTTRGVVRIVVAATRDGSETASALVSRGRAIIDQNRAARPTTTLRLSLPLDCARSGRATAAAKRKKRRRSLFTQTDGGRFRTRGNYGAATASGTAWLTTDRCESTRIDVREGTVRVRDLVRRRTVSVRAPGSYTARKRTAARP